MKFYSTITLGLLLSFISSCTKPMPKAETPEGALTAYVSLAFSAKAGSDKKQLMELSVGEAKAYLEQMSEADFVKQFVESKMVLVSMKTRDLRAEQSGNDVSLVYDLSFKEQKDNSPTVHTNKKIAYLSKGEDGHWRIRGTKNVKSFIERKEDLVITPDMTEPPPVNASEKK